MTRDEAVEIVRREIVPALSEELAREIRSERALLLSGQLDASALRDGLSREDAAAVLDVTLEFLEYVKAWSGKSERKGR